MRIFAVFVLLLSVFTTLPQQTTTNECSQAVHDSYRAVGPDGALYTTWHSAIDPSGCVFGHEHGSDPRAVLANYRPIYGYTASKHGMSESHAGFKSFAWNDRAGHLWYSTVHIGSANASAAACARYHTVDLLVVDPSTLAILVDIHFMADFGRAEVNTTGEPFTPASCPNQYQEAKSTSSGIRQFGAVTRGSNPYDPWRFDARGTLFGLRGSMTFWTADPLTICNDVVCDQAVTRAGATGVRRLFAYDGFSVDGSGSPGEFYTDPHGKVLRQPSDPGAVRQYIAPGVLIVPRTRASGEYCFVAGPVYQCGSYQDSTPLPSWIHAPN